MIAVTLMGGLGNQLFQYAAGRALALRHDTELLLDLSYLRGPQTGATARRFELDCFAFRAELVDGVRSYERPPEGLPLKARLRSHALARTTRYRVLRQKGMDFQPAFFDAEDFTHLVGFWQSEAYLAEAAETLRDELRFVVEESARDRELLGKIRGTPTVSVHVRRGDYTTTSGAAGFHGLLGSDYYAAALEEVTRQVGEVHAFVFSDDPSWCRDNLRLGMPTTVVDHNRGRGYADLRLLAACRHHVIANSSFSWWGAWLGEGEGSIVVAPRRWVVRDDLETGHVVPTRWRRL